NDVLRAAYQASMEGKLTTEQTATVVSLDATNERIGIINTEIGALEKLVAAYAGADGENYARVKRAAEAGEAGAGSALMRMSRPVGAIQMLQAELATATIARDNYVNILKGVPEVMDRTTTAANKNLNATNKAAAADKKAADAAEKKN